VALDVDDLLGLMRRELSDAEPPYLWSDDDLLQYLDEAQDAFARTTELFTDNTTTSITRVTVTAGEAFVALSPKIHRIRDAWLQTERASIQPANLNELDDLFCSDDYGVVQRGQWRTSTGTPYYIVTDIERDKGRLVPIPVADDTLELSVVRLPLKSVVENNGLELAAPKHQRAVVLYAKGLAYDTADADTQNGTLAAKFMGEGLGLFLDIRDETKRLRRRPGVVAYGGL
jgi:hypothetical protein